MKLTLEQVTNLQRGVQVYSSTISLTSALDGVGSQRPGKTRYPLHRRLGGPRGLSGRLQKISPPTGIPSPDRPARSESLYRLSYPGPYIYNTRYFYIFMRICCFRYHKHVLLIYFYPVGLRPCSGHDLILEVSRSHTITHHTR